VWGIFGTNNRISMMKTCKILLAFLLVLVSCLVFSQSVPSYVPTSGLVGWWPFNGNTNDLSGNNYNGILTGGQYSAGRWGLSNTAVTFNSSAPSYIDININNNLIGQFSLMMWVKANRTSTYVAESSVCSGAVSVPLANSNQNWAMIPGQGINILGVGLSFVQNGIMVGEHTANVLVSRLSYPVSSTDFNQVVVVYRTDSTFLYLNGVKVRARAMYCSSNNKILYSPIRFGGSLYSPNFAGAIDDIGIWNRALTQQEITNLYNSNSVGINENIQSNLFSIFPNPTQSLINVKVDSKYTGAVYSIYENTGKAVLTGKINSENTTIDLGNLSGGLYMFMIGDNMKQNFKIIKSE